MSDFFLPPQVLTIKKMKKVLKALIINDKKIHIINFRPIIEENSSSKRVLQHFCFNSFSLELWIIRSENNPRQRAFHLKSFT